MRWSSVALVAPVLAGCSLIYNPNNLPDPRMIDAAIADVNPAMPVVLDFAPDRIDEGQGEGGSVPALLVLHGQNFVNAHTKLVLTPPSGTTVNVETVGEVSVSSSGDYIAFQVIAHVDGNLTGPVMLGVAVTQDVTPQYGGGTATSVPPVKQLTLSGLPELKGSGSTTITTTTLANKYSQVKLESVTFDGTAPAIVRSVSSLQITGSIAAKAQSSKAGPGGVTGGGTTGGGPGGGLFGTPAQVAGVGGGGGGAGLATDGTAGQNGGLGGGTGGAAGHHTGDDLIASLTANQPSAGGGGGAGLLVATQPGGPGGSGGGIVVLTAGGDLAAGTINADGGKGGDAGAGAGGGGGGAGGVVIVSSDAGKFSVGAISIKAGPGGGGGGGGGGGSVGRTRWDAIAGTAPMSPDRTAHRGPVFMVPAPVVRTQPQTLTLVGTRNDGFSLRVTDQTSAIHDGGHNSIGQDDTAPIAPTLYPGYNRVCITLDGGMQGNVESDKCTEVAYLP